MGKSQELCESEHLQKSGRETGRSWSWTTGIGRPRASVAPRPGSGKEGGALLLVFLASICDWAGNRWFGFTENLVVGASVKTISMFLINVKILILKKQIRNKQWSSIHPCLFLANTHHFLCKQDWEKGVLLSSSPLWIWGYAWTIKKENFHNQPFYGSTKILFSGYHWKLQQIKNGLGQWAMQQRLEQSKKPLPRKDRGTGKLLKNMWTCDSALWQCSGHSDIRIQEKKGS